MRFLSVFIMLILTLGFCNAQRDFSEVVIKTEKLTNHLYKLEGSGGNILIFSGSDGIFMIDSQFAPLTNKIKDAIGVIQSGPVKYLMNTHYHGDHTGGNENIGKGGTMIIAHDNVYRRLSQGATKLSAGREIPPAPKEALPVISFSEDMKLHLNGEDIHAFHVEHAHTDGDVIIYFPKSNVMHMGDTFFKDRFPYIDLNSGGSVNGLLKAIGQALLVIDDETKIVPGHGSMANKEDLEMYQKTIMTIRDRVNRSIRSGLELKEIKAANITKEFESWGTGFISADRFIDTIYKDLTKN